MSGLDLEVIHEALADQIRNGIADAGGFTVKAFPSTSPAPVIEVWPSTGEYVTYFTTSGADGVADVALTIRVILAAANAETHWKKAARLLSAGTGHTSSIPGAVMADRTLGGAVADAYVGTSNVTATEDGWTVDIPVLIQLNKEGAQV